ncbi:MAG TPA: hypothetical protein VHR17_11520 [Thermoanaerobaculia bacterium]|nr:hypothetical protein [Thermoanaerobaculia bacterium]
MEFMRKSQRPALLALLSLSLLFGGCASGGIFGGDDDDDNGGYDNGDSDRDDDRVSEVRGRVDRIDTREEIIYVEASDVYRSSLRNDSGEIAIYYDDQTDVEYDGKTYEPTALEEGDRIVVDVEDTGNRLYARDIEVTYDVTAGDRDDDYDRDEISEVRGTVRWIDQDRRLMELEDTSWGFGSDRDRDDDDVVEVYYDSSTVVEYDGRSYKPENLERGDEVRVDVRRSGSRYEADEIQVVENVRD